MGDRGVFDGAFFGDLSWLRLLVGPEIVFAGEEGVNWFLG